MLECECGAHWMQSCSWWCGQGLSEEEIWRSENPELAEIRDLKSNISELKEVIQELKGKLRRANIY